MSSTRRTNSKFSRKSTRIRKALATDRALRTYVRAGGRFGGSRRFARGYDRVGGLYKLHGPVKRGGELKYSDKTWSLSKVEAEQAVNRDDDLAIQWTNATKGAVGALGMYTNQWYIAQSLVTIKQGQGPSNRIGRKFTLKSISSKMGISVITEETASMDMYCRVVWVQDKQCNGSLVGIADVFEDIPRMNKPLDEGGNFDITSLPNMGNSQRFVTLKDDVFKLTKNFLKARGQVDSGALFQYDGTFSGLRETWLPCNMEIEQIDVPAQISGIKSNNVICLVQVMGVPLIQTSTGSTGQGQIKIWGNMRTRYDDN